MLKSEIGIFFGTETGNIENIAIMIQQKLSVNNLVSIYNIANITVNDIKKYDKLILGVSTWYYGEVQCDWNYFLPELKKISFSKKTVALFGCGDQELYSEYFCDAMRVIYDIVKFNGANIIGSWPNIDYRFSSSKSLIDEHFIGLVIDEDNQSHLTNERVINWTNQINYEFSNV